MITSLRATLAFAFLGVLSAFLLLNAVRSEGNGPDIANIRELLAIGSGNEVKHYSTLPEMVGDADLIVQGKATSAEKGRVFGRAGIDQVLYATVWVEPDEILAGVVPADRRERLAVEFFLGREDTFDEFAARIEGLNGIWILTDKEMEAARLGLSGDLVSRDAGYYMVVSSQGLIANIDGVAVNAMGERTFDSEALYDATNDRPFDEARAAVVTLAGR